MNLYSLDRSIWINGITRNDLPLLETPVSFFHKYPAWEIAHQQFFDNYPHLDNEKNRNQLAIHMIKCYQENPYSLPVSVSQDLRNEFEDRARGLLPAKTSHTFLEIIGKIFLNIITIGLYGIIVLSLQNQKFKKKAQVLKEQRQYAEDVGSRIRDLGESVQDQCRQMRGKIENLARIESQITSLRQELKTFEAGDGNIDGRIAEAKRSFTSIEETWREIVQFEENKRPVVIVDQPTPEGGKGWIRPAYFIKDTDKKTITGITSETSRMTAALDACVSMEDLLKKSFEHVIVSMEEAGSSYACFNRSSKIINETEEIEAGNTRIKHIDKINSIYSFMALTLILRSELKRTNAHDARLILNKKGITVASSQPFSAKQDQVFFKHHDEWTPPLDRISNGVDPISAKYLLTQIFDEDHLKAVYALLLDPWLANDNQALTAAKALRDGRDKVGQAVKAVMPLIGDIASMLQLRYQSVIYPLLKAYFNDEKADVFDKRPATFEIDQDVRMNRILKWEPMKLSAASFHLDVARDLESTRQILAPIWEDIRSVLERPLADNPALVATKYKGEGNFWSFHAGIDGHGCLFSALAACLFQGASQKRDIDPQRLKNFMATWLEKGAGERFASTISSELEGWTWQQYVQFLRGYRSRSTSKMGDLELNLLSHALEVHIEVFSNASGYGYTIKNGVMNSCKHFGPVNSKERIMLFNSNNSSYYTMFPKVRQPRVTDSFELKRALKSAHAYWGMNDEGDFYGERYWPNFHFTAV